MRDLYSVIESITSSHFTRHEINESILDDDDKISKQADDLGLKTQLIENGIYFACDLTQARFKVACENNLVSSKDGDLCFFNDNVKAASEVVIDYKKAKDVLKKKHIRSIEAPFISIINAGEDFSIFGILKTRFLRIFQPETQTIKDLKVVPCRDWNAMFIINTDINFRNGGHDFVNIRNGINNSTNNVKIQGFDKIELQNCDINLKQLTVYGDGLELKNCKGVVRIIEVYEPSLFDGDYGKELFRLFDPDYKFSHYIDHQSEMKERKTSSLRKILAFFGNKHYYCPDKIPYKVVSKVKDVCDISKLNNLDALIYRDNNYVIEIVKTEDGAQRLQDIDRLKYIDNDHHKHPIEKTSDGYYVVIFTSR